MPLVLARRDTEIRESMDDPGCDLGTLHNTYRQFQGINAWLSRTGALYSEWIRPAMRDPLRTYTLLDIGCGAGDIARYLHRCACRDGLRLRITGVDIDPRALDYLQRLRWPEDIAFELGDARGLVARGKRYDFVISNHLLHHLDHDSLQQMLRASAALCGNTVVFSDVRRSDLAYLGFALLTLFGFRRSFIRHDGLLSIRRSYTDAELRRTAPPDWVVERRFPFRLILRYPAVSAEPL